MNEMIQKTDYLARSREAAAALVKKRQDKQAADTSQQVNRAAHALEAMGETALGNVVWMIGQRIQRTRTISLTDLGKRDTDQLRAEAYAMAMELVTRLNAIGHDAEAAAVAETMMNLDLKESF